MKPGCFHRQNTITTTLYLQACEIAAEEGGNEVFFWEVRSYGGYLAIQMRRDEAGGDEGDCV